MKTLSQEIDIVYIEWLDGHLVRISKVLLGHDEGLVFDSSLFLIGDWGRICIC